MHSKATSAADPQQQALDTLFEALREAPTAEDAVPVEARIRAYWMNSGSDTADLLLQWAVGALALQDDGEALDELDMAIAIKPDFSEAYSRRANLYFGLGRYDEALGDLEHALAIEPRRFDALAGLGALLEARGNKKGALAAYRKALALNPFLPALAGHVKTLAVEVEGLPT